MRDLKNINKLAIDLYYFSNKNRSVSIVIEQLILLTFQSDVKVISHEIKNWINIVISKCNKTKRRIVDIICVIKVVVVKYVGLLDMHWTLCSTYTSDNSFFKIADQIEMLFLEIYHFLFIQISVRATFKSDNTIWIRFSRSILFRSLNSAWNRLIDYV